MSIEDAPFWWTFELELSPHVQERMMDRGFTEVDLRLMLESVLRLRPNPTPGRWTIVAVHEGETWEVIAEPDERDRVIIVITAYRVQP